MNKNNVIETLREEVIIPDAVQNKADAAFNIIHKEVNDSMRTGEIVTLYPGRRAGASHRRKAVTKKMWLAFIAAILAFGTINVTAAYIKQSRSLTEGLRVTELQQTQMQDNHMTTVVNRSSVSQGITVTVLQSVTDNYYTHIAFRVEGYKPEAGQQPDFELVDIKIDGKDGLDGGMPENSFSSSGSFYDGLVMGESGTIERADGTPPVRDEAGNTIVNYVMEDGSLEYQITLSNFLNRGFFINKPIHVELRNLGIVGRSDYSPDVNGTWTFDWTLEGSGEMAEYELDAPLGDSGARVVKAEISPISLKAEYIFPRRTEQVPAVNQNGQNEMTTVYVDPPRLMGVQMKDGKVYPNLYMGPGGFGYRSEEDDIYRATFAIDRVLDVSQVESLLFAKPWTEAGGSKVEDNYYVVPLTGGGN